MLLTVAFQFSLISYFFSSDSIFFFVQGGRLVSFFPPVCLRKHYRCLFTPPPLRGESSFGRNRFLLEPFDTFPVGSQEVLTSPPPVPFGRTINPHPFLSLLFFARLQPFPRNVTRSSLCWFPALFFCAVKVPFFFLQCFSFDHPLPPLFPNYLQWDFQALSPVGHVPRSARGKPRGLSGPFKFFLSGDPPHLLVYQLSNAGSRCRLFPTVLLSF